MNARDAVACPACGHAWNREGCRDPLGRGAGRVGHWHRRQQAAGIRVAGIAEHRVACALLDDLPQTMGAEDFGWMLAACPGAYAMLGNGTAGAHGRALHNPEYDFNDAVIPIGVRYWVNLVRELLPDAGGASQT